MNNVFKSKLNELFIKNGINATDDMLEKFSIYKDFLTEYNQKVNLTAITEENEIAVKHFLDSGIILKYCSVEKNATVADIGTGAGFPGVPLKILRPDINLTLIDSLNKRITFLNKLLTKLDIKANVLHARAEDCRKSKLCEKFDIVTSRAVAPLNILSELCLPYLKNNGMFIALKGANFHDEVELCQDALAVLNSEILEIDDFMLGEDFKRSIVKIRKKSTISIKYPRIYSKIKKSPL